MEHFGFYDRLKEDFPSQIIVDLTEKCNYACLHCPHSSFAQSDIYTGAELSMELVQKLADEVREYGRDSCQQIRFTAEGEPMLHSRFFDIIKYTVDHAGSFVSVTTNGSFLQGNIDRLIDTGVSMVDVSIDANSPEIYRQIRRGGDYEKVKAGVLELLETRKSRDLPLRIVVSFVRQPLNEHEAEAFKADWESNGVDYVVIRDLHTAAGAQLSNQIKDTGEERRPCVYLWERISLGPNGELSFCANSWMGKAVIGDYHTTSIHGLWQSEAYLKLRRMHLDNCFETGHACEQCRDWMTTRWPQHVSGYYGRGYGDMIRDFTEGKTES